MHRKRLILFTNNYPYGIHENNFIKYEIKELSKLFDNIEIINHKSIIKTSSLDKSLKNIKLNKKFSKQVNFFNIIKYFFLKAIFKKIFWKEFNIIKFDKFFFKKLKMCILEISYALILLDFLMEKKVDYNKVILYSFWSNFTLITFSMIKKKFPKAKFVARSLGSDLNGFIYNENDDYVPYKNIKFSILDKLILLGEYQKKFLNNVNIENKNINISPLGVFKQKFVKRNIEKKTIYFLSCCNFIEAKNVILMIDFLNRLSKKTNKHIHFTIIGNGKLKNKIFEELNSSKENFKYNYYEYIDDFTKFIKIKKINFFLNFSSQEGMPFTVMETMSIGIPTISSNIKPNKYLVKNNGYLFSLSNYEKSIEQTIKNINFDLKNKRIYLNKCLKSYNFINRFLINKNCYKKFETILKKI